jgi:hypothetical protein
MHNTVDDASWRWLPASSKPIVIRALTSGARHSGDAPTDRVQPDDDQAAEKGARDLSCIRLAPPTILSPTSNIIRSSQDRAPSGYGPDKPAEQVLAGVGGERRGFQHSSERAQMAGDS